MGEQIIYRAVHSEWDPEWDTAPVGCEDMRYPFRCRWCRAVYDLACVEVTARYADCSVWKAPCCGNTADDRDPSWGGGGTKLKCRTPIRNGEEKEAGRG